jgi:hypothetical protein|tara:strand:+ start:1147 stop:1518 length:372 start_codon:yes stop_codon:yes gene_type:complete
MKDLSEIISMETRRKMAKAARRTAKRRAMSRKRKEKRIKSGPALKAKAGRAARSKIIKKLFGKTPYSQMSLGQKQNVGRALDKKKAAIAKLTKKLFPRMKKAETERIRKLMISKKGETGIKTS